MLDQSKLSKVESKVLDQLHKVEDPEVFLPITDMGLIYGIQVTEKVAKITMTLTSLGCPLFAEIEREIYHRVTSLKEINELDIDLTFDPPWNPDMMTEDAKAELGIG